jgi:hypothetical protein
MKRLLLLRNKKGNVSLLLPMFIFLSFFFIAIIVDFGKVYLARTQVQNIADAASIGGASYGMYAYYSIVDRQPRAIIHRDDTSDGPGARRKTYEIINANLKHLPTNTSLSNVQVNPSGLNGKPELDQYYSGDLTVIVQAKTIPSVMKNLLVNERGDKLNFPFFETTKSAQTHVDPVIVP